MLNLSDEKLAEIMENFDQTWSTGSSSSTSSRSSRSSGTKDYEVGDAYSRQDAIRPLVATNCSEYVVAHARCELHPVRRFGEVSLLPHILEMMRKLGLNRLLRLQSYTWPHLAGGAGHGAMIVGAPGSGRTFAYVPVVCHAVCKALAEIRSLPGDWPPNQYGPRALILVPDLRRVRQVSAMCHALLRKAHKEDWLTLTLNVPSTRSSEFFQRLLNGVGCLVVTPTQLNWFYHEAPGLMRFPCLQFVVYDDVDLMSQEQLANAEQVLAEILPLSHSPQRVMVSQSYNPELMVKLKAVNDHPALIFGDILEAALYGGTRIRISLLRAAAKVNGVLQMLLECPPEANRTVIFCSDDGDMQRLVAALEDRGYNCLPYYQTSDLQVREELHRWQAAKRGGGVILLCTDDCPELIIRNAHSLIHFSMSTSWSKFKMRHLMVADNLGNTLAERKAAPLHSLVLLDDNNHRELPRLVDFLQLHQEVDPTILSLAKRIRKELAQAKCCNRSSLCSQILRLGQCYDPCCVERHHVGKFDGPDSHLPTSGDVKLQLVQVYSPTHLCVRLLEHLPLEQPGNWQELPYPAVQEMRMQLMRHKEPPRYWPPLVGAICMYHTSFTQERVRILKVPPIKNVNIVESDLQVELQALDVDTRIFTSTCGDLYECPEALQQEPPLACDLRLLGMIPYNGERSWTEEDGRNVKYTLGQLPKEHFLQAKVQFSAAGTLFVRDLVAMVYADQFRVHLRQLSLAQHLVKATLAKRCERAAEMVKDFFGELLTKREEDELQKEEKEEQPQEKPLLSLRCQRLAQVALESGRENQLKQELKQRNCSETKEVITASNQDAQPQSKEDHLSQLYECMMNCSRLQLEDQKESSKDGQQIEAQPVEFLKQVISGESSTPDHFQEQIEIPSQQPPNVVRPSVSYYQTISTLELQVSLPEDDYEYRVQLIQAQIIFRATSKSSQLIQQFLLTLRFPYTSLRHHIRGRTVYISVTKALAVADPLAFSEYRFLKPNHDMFGKMEQHRRMTQSRLLRSLEDYGYVKPKIEVQERSEESEDDERNLEGIERVDNNEICD
nr:putative ATP-dependent RNA helicase BoYb [Drosophila takahashii]